MNSTHVLNLGKVSYFCVVLLTLSGCGKGNTTFSRPDLPVNFGTIQAGDSVERVYAVLGDPLRIDLNADRAGGGAYQLETLERVNLETVLAFSGDTNKIVYLVYSGPKSAGKRYVLYIVEVSGGKVASTPMPSYQD